MPINKSALRRCQIIDDCFHKNNKKEWTYLELMGHIQDELGIESISLRSVQDDYNYLKNEKNAPIERKKIGQQWYHFYTDPTFTIRGKELSQSEKKALQDAAKLLSQFQGLPHFEAMHEVLLNIDGWKDDNRTMQRILFEENEYQGTQWISPIYKAIEAQNVIRLHYRPFDESLIFRTLHPYFLKEFRNRWYVFGYDEAYKKIASAALDRIEDVFELGNMVFRSNKLSDAPSQLFKHIIGVTLLEIPVETIRFRVHRNSAKYLETKKLHSSQVKIYEEEDHTIFEMRAIINYELKAELYRFGAAVEVLAPLALREEFKASFEKLLLKYQ